MALYYWLYCNILTIQDIAAKWMGNQLGATNGVSHHLLFWVLNASFFLNVLPFL
jgi:hypothetical protein